MTSNNMAGLVTGSDTRNEFHFSHGGEEHRPSSSISVSKVCRICADEMGYRENRELFVACHDCGLPACLSCYDYERSEGNQCCLQCNTHYKRQKVVGDEDEDRDADDFDNKLQIKKQQDDDSDHQAALNHMDNGEYKQQQWKPNGQPVSSSESVAVKDFEGEKEGYSNAEWKGRVKKWNVRQEKRGLISKDDQDEEDDYL